MSKIIIEYVIDVYVCELCLRYSVQIETLQNHVSMVEIQFNYLALHF